MVSIVQCAYAKINILKEYKIFVKSNMGQEIQVKKSEYFFKKAKLSDLTNLIKAPNFN